MKKRTVYQEPTDYFPKEIRKKLKIGEYAETEKETKKNDTTTSKAKKK